MAKRHFAQSLTTPTENSVAQAGWAARRADAAVVEPQHLLVPHSYEARALNAFNVGRWQEAMAHAMAWIRDEPFSSRSVLFASFVASTMLEDHAAAESVLRNALQADPENRPLLNNLAYALACSDRLEEAAATFQKINTTFGSDSERVVWLATGGLLAFRSKQFAEGRRLYDEAIELARVSRLSYQRAMATALLAREEVLAGTPEAAPAVARARTEVLSAGEKSIEEIFQRLVRLHSSVAGTPVRRDQES
jgi:tetratricopeptide (TPR) repeat protein